MILIDVNLLIYAHMSSKGDEAARTHAAAKKWLDMRLSRSEPVGMPWPSLLGFVRIASNPRAHARPQTIRGAWAQVEAWLDQPSVWIPAPGSEHRLLMSKLLADVGGGHNLVPDAHLAALAIEHGLTLCSTDGDFARFISLGLRWQNPLLI